jgi:quercetin dioxygenase-like cupin family protein
MSNFSKIAIAAAATLIAILPPVVAQVSSLQKRLTPTEIESLPKLAAGAGTSGLQAVTTTVLFGDPARAGLYSIELKVAPNTIIKAHTHRDHRTATVVSGSWYFGYGAKNDEGALKLLTAGSFYTEPGGEPHFARTKADGAVVMITGYGPSDTNFVEQ